MLEGIEILEKIEITSPSDFSISILIFSIVWLLLSFVAILIGSVINSETLASGGGITCFISLLLILIGLCICSIHQVPTGEYKYTVIIDDSVTINEFYERYNVIAKNGKIWTITDKGVE